MLAFLDESGDTGRKTDKGSSGYFIVSLVIFLDDEEAIACDRRIDLLRTELNLSPDYEFHFSRNSGKVKEAFLNAISPYNFSIVTVIINKDPSKLYGDGFGVKSSFYKYACQMVLTNALPYLDKAILVLDKSGSATFQGELKRYLKKKLADENGFKIAKIKSQDSHCNNLLQLVDYCVSLSNRRAQGKPKSNELYRYLASKELSWQVWPK